MSLNENIQEIYISIIYKQIILKIDIIVMNILCLNKLGLDALVSNWCDIIHLSNIHHQILRSRIRMTIHCIKNVSYENPAIQPINNLFLRLHILRIAKPQDRSIDCNRTIVHIHLMALFLRRKMMVMYFSYVARWWSWLSPLTQISRCALYVIIARAIKCTSLANELQLSCVWW